MKHKQTALTAILLALLSAASCGGNDGTAASTDTAAPDTAISDTAAVTQAPESLSPYEAQDFGGEEIVFLVIEQSGINFNLRDVYAEEENGDILNDAVYRRNSAVTEKYNVTFRVEHVPSPESTIKTSVTAGDDAFDIGMPAQSAAFNLGLQGHLTDLNTVEALELDRDWWNQSVLEGSRFYEKNFFVIGDINLLSYDGTGVVMFSKPLAEEQDIDDLYASVKDGTWTFDKMKTYAKSVFGDLNGDGKDDAGDRYGFTCNLYASDCFAMSTDIVFTERDGDGLPVYGYNTERFYDYFADVIELINDRSITLFADRSEYKNDRQTIPLNAFIENRVLFYYETMAFMAHLRNMEFDFGLLPFPKLDETQDTYYNFIHTACSSTVTIPRTAEGDEAHLAMLGTVLNDMGFYSGQLVRPAYYETTVAGKYIRDDESYEMLDYILQNSRCDFMHLTTTFLQDLRGLISNNKTDIASQMEKKEKVYGISFKNSIKALTGE